MRQIVFIPCSNLVCQTSSILQLKLVLNPLLHGQNSIHAIDFIFLSQEPPTIPLHTKEIIEAESKDKVGTIIPFISEGMFP